MPSESGAARKEPWNAGASKAAPSKAAIVERFFLTLFFLLTAALGIAWFTQRSPEYQVLRFAVAPPPGTTFAHLFDGLAISHDSRLLVFSAARAGEEARLWLRPLDSLEAKELAGTEGASYPFWSPDGKWVGFFADGKLKRLETSGGSAEVLCEVPEAQGGAWSQEGVILFAGGKILQRVPAGGGTPVAVTTLANGETSQRWPQFLPDGHGFLYLSAAAGGEGGVYAAALDRPQRGMRLAATDFGGAYAAPRPGRPGQLVWLRMGTLWSQKFDLDLVQVQGAPVAIEEGAAGTAAFGVSANGILVYGGEGLTVVSNWQTLLKK